MALNPLAAEFVPLSRRCRRDLAYTGWGRCGTSHRRRCSESFNLDPGEPSNGLTEIPKEIVAAVLSKLENPADVLAVALVSKGMLIIASEAALRLRISAQQLLPSDHSFLKTAPDLFPGIVELNLSGCFTIEDCHVVAALRRLPRLRCLDLSVCRKLSPGFLKQALAASHEAATRLPEPGRGLRVLGLQRCFQLDSCALTDVVAAAASTHSSLAAVTLSHLSLDRWPEAADARPLPPPGNGNPSPPKFPLARTVPYASLRILALHNCKCIAADGLAYLAACCPDLEMLLLGGSSLDVSMVARAADDASERGSQPPSDLPNNPPPAITGTLDGLERRYATALVDAAQALPRLCALELTFFFRGVISGAAAQLPGVEVLDFARAESLETAQRLLGGQKWRGSRKGLALALSAAANCSSHCRHTPLHAAVEANSPDSIEMLLRLGGHLEARDHQGATPLFLACESDRLRCAQLLLRAGAELRTRNAGGEAPLYIAALRGHDGVVEALLTAFNERGLKWTESELYGDRWNPLMAAAVADRHSTAVRLLRAAGPDAEGLALATNRYGQSAGHIAARKGSAALLRALIDAAGHFVALVPDNDDKTPLAVARAHKQQAAATLLQQAADAFHAAWPGATPPRQHRRPYGQPSKPRVGAIRNAAGRF